MKYIFISMVILFSCGIAVSGQTNITSPIISGNWTASGSPYHIYNNVKIDAGTALRIDPGVQVVFHGGYHIDVQGVLIAKGSLGKWITFTAFDTAVRWNSIIYETDASGNDSSGIDYCTLSYGGGIVAMRPIEINHSDFSHCGGAVSASLSPITVRNSRFYKNGPVAGGTGGVFVAVGTGANIPVVINDSCSFFNNEAPGLVSIFTIASCNTTFTNNKIFNNKCEMVVIQAYNGGQLKAKGNIIHHNTTSNYASIFCTGLNTQIQGNIICNNRNDKANCGFTDGGAGIFLHSGIVSTTLDTFQHLVYNNIIANNSTLYHGGGIRVIGTTAIIFNNDIVNNVAYVLGGAIDHSRAKLRITNNIFWGNVTYNPYGGINTMVISGYGKDSSVWFDYNRMEHPLSLTLDRSFFPNVFSGDSLHNIAGSMCPFVAPTAGAGIGYDAMQGNFRLIPKSDCIDKGDTSDLPIPAEDYAGKTRILGRIDIGAFESEAAQPQVIEVSVMQKGLDVFPLPAHGRVTIVLPSAEPGILEIMNGDGRHMTARVTSELRPTLDISSYSPGLYFIKWAGKGRRAHTAQMVVY